MGFMKGVVLAGGLGTSYDKAMICYPIQTLIDANIRDILVVVGGETDGFIKLLGEMDLAARIQFTYQRGEGGIPGALRLAEDFADHDNLAVILGDNCTDADISKDVKEFKDGAKIFLKKVEDPERFGVPTFRRNGQISEITEKPKNPASNYAVTGLYLYDNTVFDKIRELIPSERGELEVTDLNKLYLQKKNLGWTKLEGFWKDAGTFGSLAEVYQYWADKALRKRAKERD